MDENKKILISRSNFLMLDGKNMLISRDGSFKDVLSF